MNIIVPLFMIMLLTGCAFDSAYVKPETKIEVVTVEKPLLYCPAPPVIPYPALMIRGLVPGDEVDPGRVVQFYKATVKQMEGEIRTRDLIINAYDQISKKSPDLKPAEVDVMFKELTNEVKPTTK